MGLEKLRHWLVKILRHWEHRFGSLVSMISIIWVGGVLVTLLTLWVFLELADEVLAKQTQLIDQQVLNLIIAWRTPSLTVAMHGFSLVGGTVFVTLLAISVGILFWRLNQKSALKTFAVLAIGGTLLNLLIKQVFQRDRPNISALVEGNPRTSSFPSGHAMMSVIIYGFITYVLANAYPRWRWWIIGVWLLLVLGIGISRLYLGIHYPSDVLAGYMAGLTWLLACILSWETRLAYRKLKRSS